MNTEQLLAEWQRVIEKIQEDESIDSSQVSAIFSRLQPQAMSNGFLMLTSDNGFIKNWVESHYAANIKQALKDIHGQDFTVLIEVDENQQVPQQPSVE